LHQVTLTTQVVRNRPEASSEITVKKLQQFKQRFQEKIEVWFGVVLLDLFGIVSRGVSMLRLLVVARCVLVTSFGGNCCMQPVARR
jgi:hypothetical protein